MQYNLGRRGVGRGEAGSESTRQLRALPHVELLRPTDRDGTSSGGKNGLAARREAARHIDEQAHALLPLGRLLELDGANLELDLRCLQLGLDLEHGSERRYRALELAHLSGGLARRDVQDERRLVAALLEQLLQLVARNAQLDLAAGGVEAEHGKEHLRVVLPVGGPHRLRHRRSELCVAPHGVAVVEGECSGTTLQRDRLRAKRLVLAGQVELNANANGRAASGELEGG
mmetsp:Transcript_29353/g.87362  ORF Transcript_29353/g.87362 Transcript_29353/m.87362 type:complete len:230 (+) Transcript_29353:2933-3622(+)